ncbi:MAG: hypothetical protein RL033_1317 [Pseudomonadota bacterium]|jgi:hypothetical protein
MAVKSGPSISVEEFLSGCSEQGRGLAHAARRRISGAVPHATERVRLGWRLIGYNAPSYFAFITVEEDHVRIGFEWGIRLADPTRLLEGDGSQVRYVPIRSTADLRGAALAALLRSAASLVPPPRPGRRGR